MYSLSYYSDSWIEISSQPSSSSLSSAAADDVVTTGLRVQHDSNTIRRRRLTQNLPSGSIPSRRMSTAGSSQDEYEESESESDRVMNSSNEDISTQPSPVVRRTTSETSDGAASDDDDGNSTALGLVSDERAFTPQPNAFSHPPISRSNRSAEAAPSSYFPQVSSSGNQSTTQRHSYPSQRTHSHTPYNVISPSHQTDHDAALRASLSTLLSCAAAARGLPKRDQAAPTVTASGNRIEPTTLRMVPESVLMGEEEPQLPVRRISHRTTGSSSSASISIPPKGKRKASSSKDRRAPKKSRKANMDDMITPTMMTWVISASVVVLFSAISFSAGYAFGREVGRSEAGAIGVGEGVSCGKEAMKGSFRKLRWGTGSSTSVRV
jgi:hypothetical protein